MSANYKKRYVKNLLIRKHKLKHDAILQNQNIKERLIMLVKQRAVSPFPY